MWIASDSGMQCGVIDSGALGMLDDSDLIASAAANEKTIASRREFEARRFAPWTPVEVTSPLA